MIDTTRLTPHARCTSCGKLVELDADGCIPQHDHDRWGAEQKCWRTDPIPKRLTHLADPDEPAVLEPHSTNPMIEFITPEEIGDAHWHRQTLERGEKAMRDRIPPHYRDAVVTVPEVETWVRELIRSVDNDRRTVPVLDRGKSLLLVGPTGTGKTFTAYGVVRALSVCGVSAPWLFTTAADMYAQLRPRPRVDSEEEFEKYARATFLVLDDLGAAKGSEWNEEINYRLINYRYEREKPTLITSNVPPKDLADVLGGRVASRLREMAQRVVLRGEDRRTEPTATNGAAA